MADHSTHEARAEVTAALAIMLGDTFRLYAKTHGFHGNVTGLHRQSLRRMFDGQYRELRAAIDPIAERIRALGGSTPRSLAALAALGELAKTEGMPIDREMTRAAFNGHLTLARRARVAREAAESAGDPMTADLMTDRLASHENAAWMLRAQLVDEPPSA
ncbi:MAG: DNA starvation/stationary phase protection protein [Geminicoccaceae bacterium]|nr:MAG: DNA starvation/stationary phase protection protein [Geminicoccaceae bacterium]